MTQPTKIKTIPLTVALDKLREHAERNGWCSEAEEAFIDATGIEFDGPECCRTCERAEGRSMLPPAGAPADVPIEPLLLAVDSKIQGAMEGCDGGFGCCTDPQLARQLTALKSWLEQQ